MSIRYTALRLSLMDDRLSTSFVDAEFVLDVKIKNGRRMFHEEPVDRKVTFEIKCHDSKTKRTV